MTQFIKKRPLHAFLIGLYIISFIYTNNITKVSFSMTYRSIVVSLIVTFLLFGISYLFYRSQRKAGIFTTLVIVSFFIYGIVYDKLEYLFYQGQWPFSHIHRFLIAAYLLIYLLIFIIFYRSNRPHYTVNYVLNIFVLALFGINLLSLIVFAKENKKDTNQAGNPLLSNLYNAPQMKAPASSPDVYYIILDGYASEQTLEKFYARPKPKMYQYLRERGFYVADSSLSNYPVTTSSLSSSLNMTYLTGIKSEKNLLIDQNLVSYLFKKHGYRIVNIESGYAVTENFTFSDKTIKIKGLNEFENRLIQLTVLRLDDILGVTTYMRLRSQLDELPTLINEEGPKFTFIHIVAPHPPYVVDSLGRRKVRTSLSDAAWEPRSDYLQQMDFVRDQVIKFLDSAKKVSKTPPIIVLQSDHGPWLSDSNVQNRYNARMHILNAYYVPDSIKVKLYPDISPVNSFRVILSSLFHLNYPLLPDTTKPLQEMVNDPTFKNYGH